MITFNYLLEQTRLYKNSIIIANILAVLMTLISVPIPLFIPQHLSKIKCLMRRMRLPSHKKIIKRNKK